MNPLLMIEVDKIADTVGLDMLKTDESTYAVAQFMMKCVGWFMKTLHLPASPELFTFLYALLVFFVAFIVGMTLRWVVVFTLDRISPYVKSDLYSYLIKDKFFSRLCRIVPALIFIILLQFTLNHRVTLSSWLERISWVYVVLIIIHALCTLVDSIWNHVNTKSNSKKLPLKGVAQLIKIILYLIFIVLSLSIIFEKSPASWFAGIGAFSAVLMLVFKDSILGVVAGVQLSQDNSLTVGDWIAVPGTNVNGTVMDVGLTSVKVQNWDKTTSTIPPYNLITVGFQNYRTMQQSNTRRIQRSYMIDSDSVKPTDDAMLQEFANLPLMKDWITKKIAQRDAGKTEDVNNSEGLVDGSIETNLGIFRAYVRLWLDANPHIDKQSDCFVTTLAQTSAGIPLQVYCFTNTSAWFAYEGIMACVFENIAAMLPKFKLYTFENPSGRDTVIEGWLSPGKPMNGVLGVPYPMIAQPQQPVATNSIAQS